MTENTKKIMDKCLANIFKTKDFATAYSYLEEHAIQKGIEGTFAIVKHLYSDNYLYTPELILGDETSVSGKIGVERAKELLGKKYEHKSIHTLVKSPRFLEDVKINGLEYAVPIKKISRKHDWNTNINQAKHDLANEYYPYLKIHNHPNGLALPSIEDLIHGFNIQRLCENNPFYQIVIGSTNKDNVSMFLMKFTCNIIEQKAYEKESMLNQKNYDDLITRIRMNQINKNGSLASFVLKELERKTRKKHYGFEWETYTYNPEQRKITLY